MDTATLSQTDQLADSERRPRRVVATLRAAWGPAALVLVGGILVEAVRHGAEPVRWTAIVAALVAVASLALWSAAHTRTLGLEDDLQRLRVSEAEMRKLLDDLPDAVMMVSASGTVLDVNALALRLTGRTREQLVGHPAMQLVAPDQRAAVVDAFHRSTPGELTTFVFVLQTPHDGSVWVEASYAVPLGDGEHTVVTLRDVTARERSAEVLRAAQERFRLAFHSAPSGMMLATWPTLTLIDVNESFARLMGAAGNELIGKALDEITHPDDYAAVDVQMSRPTEEPIRVEQRYVRPDGDIVWARVSMTQLGGNEAPLVIAHVEDVTDQRKHAQQLQYAASHDLLTGLPNRTHFLSSLREKLLTAPVGSVSVLFIDLDNFKVINDSLGHSIGDDLLREMSERLRSIVRDRHCLGRFGGDEFMVLLDGVQHPDPFDVAERLRATVGTPVLIDGNELFVTASIGIATTDRTGVTADELLRDADAAMYRAKARGRDCVERFAPGSHESSVLALRTANELRRGLERGEIVPYFQPIVDLSGGRLTGFEVLARWRHPDRGLVGPDQFLPMAEETGLITEVGLAVLRTSLSQVGRWRARHRALSHVTVSVNVSVRQLMDSRFLSHVEDALAESGLEADALWLEITETALMTDVKVATTALRDLRSLGLHLAVDDFGTGYSSLTYLKRFPVEAIKVDRSFVNGLGIDTEDTTIVEAVVNLGHSLGLAVVAEGVETPLQLNRLRELRCDRGQGYLFGRPRPAELIEAERLEMT